MNWITRTVVLAAALGGVGACGKDKATPSYYLSANLNGQAWHGVSNHSWAQIEYDYNQQEHHLSVIGDGSQAPIGNAKYDLSLLVNARLQKGRYYFRNTGGATGPSEVVGGLNRDVAGSRDNLTGLRGYVDVIDITKDIATGTFQFTAYDRYATTPTDSMQVSEGKFKLPITMVTGMSWNGL